MRSVDDTLTKIIDERIQSIAKDFDERFSDDTIAGLIGNMVKDRIDSLVCAKIESVISQECDLRKMVETLLDDKCFIGNLKDRICARFENPYNY